jgi:hypothetical protein
MKAIKSLLLGGISIVLANSCLDPPEFPDRPEITFESIYFGDHPNASRADSLVISLSFKDGDGDLGLPTESIDSPYHQNNFYVGVNGQMTPVFSQIITDFLLSDGTRLKYHTSGFTPEPSFVLGFIPPAANEMITFDSRTSGYPSLPETVPPSFCSVLPKTYLTDTIFIFKQFKHAVKDKSTIVDSLVDNSGRVYLYALLDEFYVEANPRQYNIYVQFFVLENGGFREFKWEEEYCQTYNGRFPVLSEKDGPLEGTLDYSMVGTGFLSQFSIKQMNLRITVYDRANHTSNTVETGPFTLEKIRR